MNTEQIVNIAAKLYDARRSLRSIWDAEYEKKIAPWRELVRAVMAKEGCSAPGVPLLLKDKLEGWGMVKLLAATVDVAEGLQ